MEYIFIENECLKVGVKLFGAELTSVIAKDTNTEYMYQPDGIHWNKQSPILFPNIGAIKENSFIYKGKKYPARKHGFARDYAFCLEEKGDHFATFLLTNEMTNESYPFEFELRLKYTLHSNSLELTYQLSTASPELYFAIGGHPAFAVPLEEGLTFEDYHIQLTSDAPISKLELEIPYLASLEGVPFTEGDFALHHDLFTNDVLLFKSLTPNFKGKLYSPKGTRSVTIHLNGIEALGVWTNADDSPFVCFEPWDGYPDISTESTLDLEEKKNILRITSDKPYQSTATFVFE